MNTDFDQFDTFASYVAMPGLDLSRFKDSYFHMLDINGAVPAYTLGFNFELNEEEEDSTQETDKAKDIFETFKPAVIYVGTPQLQARLDKMGYTSQVFSWFEGGGFALVLKVPAVATTTDLVSID